MVGRIQLYAPWILFVGLGSPAFVHAQAADQLPEAPPAYVSTHSAGPSSARPASAPALELTWVLMSTSRSSRFYRLFLFVRVDGGPARRFALGQVPELLPTLCMEQPGPDIQLRFRNAGAGLERIIVERAGTRYTVRRQDRTTRPLGWAPWRSYDARASRLWRFEGPSSGSFVVRAFENGRELPCRPGTL